MNSKRFFIVMIGVVVLLSGVIVVCVVFGNSILKKQATKLLDLKLQNQVLDEEQASLVQANKDIVKYADLEKIAKAIVPQDKDQAQAVREIVSIATNNGITLKTVSFPTSTLGQTPTSSSSSSSSTKVTSIPFTQVKAVSGIPGVYSMDITIQSDETKLVSYRNFLNFLDGLEKNRRTAQVTSIVIQPSAQKKDALSFNITVSVFIKP